MMGSAVPVLNIYFMFQAGSQSCAQWRNNEPPNPLIQLHTEPLSMIWKGSLHVDAGLKNLGNTCYLNSSIQVMWHVTISVIIVC